MSWLTWALSRSGTTWLPKCFVQVLGMAANELDCLPVAPTAHPGKKQFDSW